MNLLTNKIKSINFFEEKKRLLLFGLLLICTLFLAFNLLQYAYSRYEIRAKVNANIDKALYIFEDNKTIFNIEPTGIIPRNEPYTYRFSVSNYNANKHSDVDISYQVKVRTTTNLPINISMYCNELPETAGATNLFQGSTTTQDEDGAWYREYTDISSHEMAYDDDTTDIYTVVISFPSLYSNNIVYANYLESVEVILESHQII